MSQRFTVSGGQTVHLTENFGRHQLPSWQTSISRQIIKLTSQTEEITQHVAFDLQIKRTVTENNHGQVLLITVIKMITMKLVAEHNTSVTQNKLLYCCLNYWHVLLWENCWRNSRKSHRTLLAKKHNKKKPPFKKKKKLLISVLYLNPVILTKLEKETSWLQAPTAWESHPPGCRTRTTLKNIPNHPETLTVDTELGCGVWPKLSKVRWRERDSCKWNSYNQTWKRQLKVKQLQPNMSPTAIMRDISRCIIRQLWNS